MMKDFPMGDGTYLSEQMGISSERGQVLRTAIATETDRLNSLTDLFQRLQDACFTVAKNFEEERYLCVFVGQISLIMGL